MVCLSLNVRVKNSAGERTSPLQERQLTAEPQLGEQPEEQLHAVLVVGHGGEGGEAAGLEEAPDPDHHQHLPQHPQRRPVSHEAEPGPDH